MTSGLLLHTADRKAACFHARCTDDRVCTEIAVAHVQGALCIDACLGEDPPSAEWPPLTVLPMPARLLRQCNQHLARIVLGRSGYGNGNNVSGVISQGSREVIEWSYDFI